MTAPATNIRNPLALSYRRDRDFPARFVALIAGGATLADAAQELRITRSRLTILLRLLGLAQHGGRRVPGASQYRDQIAAAWEERGAGIIAELDRRVASYEVTLSRKVVQNTKGTKP